MYKTKQAVTQFYNSRLQISQLEKYEKNILTRNKKRTVTNSLIQLYNAIDTVSFARFYMAENTYFDSISIRKN